ncbi:hypothetical protein [Edaphovirga cremea]|uniref:hypothetical protein n=1 Tax=Edaphovirga cremea TaxID=2267246 RepID=UPI003989C8EB
MDKSCHWQRGQLRKQTVLSGSSVVPVQAAQQILHYLDTMRSSTRTRSAKTAISFSISSGQTSVAPPTASYE